MIYYDPTKRLNLPERLTDAIVNAKKEFKGLEEISQFLFQDTSPSACQRAATALSQARKLAARHGFIISNSSDTGGIYKLENNIDHLYKQAMSSTTRGHNGVGNAQAIKQVMRGYPEGPEKDKMIQSLKDEFMSVAQLAINTYFESQRPDRNPELE